MKRLMKTSVTGLIVAVGLSAAGYATAQIQNDNSAITQATCEARLFHSERPKRDSGESEDNAVEDTPEELTVDNWSDEALELLDALDNSRYREGTLNMIDCVGSSNAARVRTQGFTLENISRRANESRGLVFSVEAVKVDEPIRRLTQLELPARNLWQLNALGNGLIAVEEFVYSHGNDNFEPFPRMRTTEVTDLNGALLVTQRTTTNDLFDELLTWTLK